MKLQQVVFTASLLFLFSTLNFSTLNAQTVRWAHSGFSPGFEYGNAITTDDSGNVYVSGQIEYTTHFDGGVNLTSHGIHDIFSGKFAPDGTIKWLRGAGGHGGDVGYGVGVDAMHNCYSTGEVEDTGFFTSTNFVISKGSNDIFVSKYDMSGNFVWVKSYGTTGSDKAFGISVKDNGDSYITGSFSGSIDFGNVHLSTSGTSDAYLLKLNANGAVQWAKKGGGSDADRGLGVASDNNGNAYVAGYFTHNATFSGTTISTGNGITSAFLARYSPTGHLDWVKGNCCGETQFNCVAVDENGNIYAAGYFVNSATFGSTTLTSSGNTDIVIVKYNSSGNIVWAKKAGGPYEDQAYGINVDTINHIVYLTGLLDDHGYFDSHYAGAAGNRDVYVAAYDQSGNNLWVKPYGGVHRDIGYGISTDKNGYIFTTGVFNSPATFGSYTLTGDTLFDFYIDKINPAPSSQPNTPSSNLSATPVNCSDLQLTFTPGNGTGRIIIATAVSPVNAPPVDGNIYHADNTFGSGDILGMDNYVVYNGSGSSVNITGLFSGVTYYFAVYEYNGSGGNTNYLTNNPAVASHLAGTYFVSIQSGSNSLCTGDTVTLTATGGTTYQWSPGAGLSASSGSVVRAFPSSSSSYTVTTNYNGCQLQNTISLTVNPLPSVTLSLINSVCAHDNPITLTGGSPVGGIYSGSGISSGTFDPSLTSIGNDPVTYTYTDGNGCSNSTSSSIMVLAAPNISLGNDTTICASNSITLQPSNGYTSYNWSTGSTLSAVTVDSSGTGLGTKNVYVAVQNNTGCTTRDTISITFSVCAGIDNADQNPSLHIFPNPFNESLRIKLDDMSDIYVYDVTGKLIESFMQRNGETIFGEDLAAGSYTVIINQKVNRSIFRVVKNY